MFYPVSALLQATPNIEILSPFLQWGLGGGVIALTFWYILYKEKAHKEERAEWRKDMLNEFEKIVSASKEERRDFTDAVKKNMELLYKVEAKLERKG